jgi:hypothetical protein
MLVQGMCYAIGLSGVRVAFVCESGTKKNLKSPRRASAASAPITERTYRQVAEYLLANGFRREIQHLANVQERKGPGTIIGCDPAMSIEIEFPLDRARSAMEPSQIQRRLFEDSGRQFLLAGLELMVGSSVHVVVFWLVISSSIFRRPIFQKISEFLRESPRSSFFLAVIVLPTDLDLSGRIETEQ